MGNAQKKENQEGKKKGNWVLAVGILLIIILLVVVIILLVKRPKEEEPKRNVVAVKDTVETVVDDMFHEQYVAPGYYSTSMSTTWHFASGDSISGDAYVENKAENTNDIYFDVFLAENEETAIYQSPVLPRGSELDNIALDTELPAGTYECVMIYHLVDGEQNTVSTVRVAFTIIIEG